MGMPVAVLFFEGRKSKMNMIFKDKYIGLAVPHHNEAAEVGPRFTQIAEEFKEFQRVEWALHSKMIRKLPHTGKPH